jgi:hypothetical protein
MGYTVRLAGFEIARVLLAGSFLVPRSIATKRGNCLLARLISD